MHAPHKLLFGLLCALLALAAGSSTAAAQEDESQVPTFRSDVRLVLHSIAVLDSQGRPVADLSQRDFVVYEDGEPVSIELFLAPDTTPLDIALVLDSSTSLFPIAATVRRAASTFLTRLEPGDCVYVLPFADTPGPGQWGRAADPALTRRIESIFMNGGTALYDALLEGLTALAGDPARVAAAPEAPEPPPDASDTEGRLPTREELLAGVNGVSAEAARGARSADCGGSGGSSRIPGAPERRRALVLFTDGADENSTRRFDEVLETARRASIPIFPVVLGRAGTDDRLHTVLETLAGSTGGMVIEGVEPMALQAAYDDVEALLRASYLVGYRGPESEPRWREVEVRSRRPSYRLVHRERYYR